MNSVPKHIGIIMDGNRRFSKKLMMKPWKGHEWGVKKVEDVLKWCHEYKIEELTLYTLSLENFNRPKEEFDYLMNLFLKEYKRLRTDKRLSEYDIRINFIGRLYMLPNDLQIVMQELMDQTKNNKGHIINFAIAYGGRQEVVDAVKKVAKAIKEGHMDIDEINEDTFSKNLYFNDEPDLIIRTGGDRRTSNFLVWQSNYSEWFFVEKCWPELSKEDFVTILDEFSNRHRRYGR
ncbi:di-trans,poly-cis-decaprenylcistransferase [Candidatus Woesearchaeota archaeon]|nr:di-trans,poly-cis-decaprenylcistransferase [Candidatus Woesearchaeota archaeon]